MWARAVAASAAIAGFTVCAFSASALHAADFYKGKELKLVSGSGVGGGYDGYSRLLARHIGDHIPGHPNLVVQNMPGASGIKAANWLYNVAPKDGTVFGGTYNNLVIEPLLGDKQTQFDPRKFQWIGAMGKQYLTCSVWHTSPVHTVEDAMKQEVKVSTTGATGNSSRFPEMLNKLLGTKFKIISGYTTSGMRLAVERGEVDGICGFSLDTFEASNPDWIRDKKLRFFLVEEPLKELPGVPRLADYVKNPLDLAAIKVLEVRDEVGRPHMLPPGVPKDRVKELRDAFMATMKDPKFLAEADKLHIGIDPLSGEQVEKEINEAYAQPKNVIDRAIELWPPAISESKTKGKKKS
jgi:tripartite-type tricarboxylate transporter receptor subunit TctC